jgi:hypothetical protein
VIGWAVIEVPLGFFHATYNKISHGVFNVKLAGGFYTRIIKIVELIIFIFVSYLIGIDWSIISIASTVRFILILAIGL